MLNPKSLLDNFSGCFFQSFANKNGSQSIPKTSFSLNILLEILGVSLICATVKWQHTENKDVPGWGVAPIFPGEGEGTKAHMPP